MAAKVIDREWTINQHSVTEKYKVLHICVGEGKGTGGKPMKGLWPIVKKSDKTVCSVCNKEVPPDVQIYLNSN